MPSMGIGNLRTFNGRQYQLVRCCFTRKEALKLSSSLRKDGHLAKAVYNPMARNNKYCVYYYHKRGKQYD